MARHAQRELVRTIFESLKSDVRHGMACCGAAMLEVFW